MAFIEYGGKRHVVPAGEMLVGTGADCHLRLEGAGIALRHAILTTAPDLSVSIRKLQEGGEVEVNGVTLGPLPQSLLHGDKVTLAGVDLLFVDERKSGSTQYVSAVKLQDLAASARKPGAGAGKATAATGGRIVSLTDGREYQVIGGSLKFGRDASADVVVAGSQVSRRHAEIVVSPRGYILVDSSTNGTFVNGERVQNQRLLARADVIRLGEEEFRFYADAAPDAAQAAAATPSPVPPPPQVAQPVGPPTPVMTSDSPASRAVAPGQSPAATLPPPPSKPPVSQPPVAQAPMAQPRAAAPPAPPAPPAAPAAPPAAPPAPHGAAQLISTGYFPSPSRGSPAAPVGQSPSPPAVAKAAPAAPPAAAPVAAPPVAKAPPAAPIAPPPVPKATVPLVPSVAPPPAAKAPVAKAAPSAPPVPPTPTPAPAGKAPQALAKFLVRSGSLKGQRLYVKVPIVNIGRAEYNDLVIPDDSVSSQHAKLTRREGVWILTDVGSTNGTLVDGERITSDTPIAPGAFVRFGDIQLVFEPTDDDAGMDKQAGTRAISAIKLTDLKPPQGR